LRYVEPGTNDMTDHKLVTPTDDAGWRAYHEIRRQVLFEARGEFGVYQEDHPDERAPGNHSKLLLHRGDPIGVVRIDVDAATAIVRRVAIRADVQRLGHGRALLSLVQQFARDKGCAQLASHVAPDAVGFYERCGFTVSRARPFGSAESKSVFMTKRL
jgi:GNAT superfamily N-acetyltransferase